MLLFFAVGCISAAIVLLPPAFLKNYDLFSTWSLASLSIVLGSTIRGLYITLQLPEPDTIDFLFLLGHSPEYFFWPSMLLLMCLFLAALGYLVYPFAADIRASTSKAPAIDDRRLYALAFTSLVITLVCVYLYIDFTGSFDFLSISKKRTSIESLDLGDSHRTWQSLRTLASISIFAHLFVLANALKTGAKDKHLKLILAAALFIAACLLPFYASSRGTIIVYVIFSLAVVHYTTRKLRLKKIFLAGLVVLILFQAMSISRASRNYSGSDSIAARIFNVKIFDKLVINRNELELAKTAHIMWSIPDTLELQYGKTIAVWLVAPIPREIWNSKPLISPGPIIGTKIYGSRRSGVPPGFVGEMYWNFYWPGVLIGGFLLGFALRWLHQTYRPDSNDSSESNVIYITGPMQLGYLIIGTSLGYGVVTTIINTLLAVVIYRIIRV